MTSDAELKDRLRRAAGHIEVGDGELPEVICRGRRRRHRRVAGLAAVGCVVLTAVGAVVMTGVMGNGDNGTIRAVGASTTVVLAQEAESGATEADTDVAEVGDADPELVTDEQAPDVPAAVPFVTDGELEFEEVDAAVAERIIGESVVMANGVRYALSTTSETRPGQPAPRSVWTRTDGAPWSELGVPDSLWLFNLSSDGTELYALGTAPGTASQTNGGIADFVLTTSGDGRSWSTVPVLLPAALQQSGSPQLISMTTFDGRAVAALRTNPVDRDPKAVLPDLFASHEEVYASHRGFLAIDPLSMTVECPEGWLASDQGNQEPDDSSVPACVGPDGTTVFADPEFEQRLVTYADAGVDPLAWVSSAVLVEISHDGAARLIDAPGIDEIRDITVFDNQLVLGGATDVGWDPESGQELRPVVVTTPDLTSWSAAWRPGHGSTVWDLGVVDGNLAAVTLAFIRRIDGEAFVGLHRLVDDRWVRAELPDGAEQVVFGEAGAALVVVEQPDISDIVVELVTDGGVTILLNYDEQWSAFDANGERIEIVDQPVSSGDELLLLAPDGEIVARSTHTQIDRAFDAASAEVEAGSAGGGIEIHASGDLVTWASWEGATGGANVAAVTDDAVVVSDLSREPIRHWVAPLR